MCDVESYVYLPLLEEMGYLPKHKYSFAPEIFEYSDGGHRPPLQPVRGCLLFQTGCHRAALGRLRPVAGSSAPTGAIGMTARFVVMANGSVEPAEAPRHPRHQRLFKGHTFHTSRWDYGYTGGDSDWQT